MKTSRPRVKVPTGRKSSRATVHPARRARKSPSPRIPARWKWHYRVLAELRERLTDVRSRQLTDATEPMERHSMHPADAATDQFDHDLALSLVSAEQDALYELDAAMNRITDGTYGICEQTGTPIPGERLKAIPWTRYLEEVEAQRESVGEGQERRLRLGAVRSLRDTPTAALAESTPTVEEPPTAIPTEKIRNAGDLSARKQVRMP